MRDPLPNRSSSPRLYSPKTHSATQALPCCHPPHCQPPPLNSTQLHQLSYSPYQSKEQVYDLPATPHSLSYPTLQILIPSTHPEGLTFPPHHQQFCWALCPTSAEFHCWGTEHTSLRSRLQWLKHIPHQSDEQLQTTAVRKRGHTSHKIREPY